MTSASLTIQRQAELPVTGEWSANPTLLTFPREGRTSLHPMTGASQWQRNVRESLHRLYIGCKGKNSSHMVEKSDNPLTEWGDHDQHHQGGVDGNWVTPGGTPWASYQVTWVTLNSLLTMTKRQWARNEDSLSSFLKVGAIYSAKLSMLHQTKEGYERLSG